MREALESYFETWHPLFPFLDGAYVLSAFEMSVNRSLAASGGGGAAQELVALAFQLAPGEGLVLSAIFKAIVAIGDAGGSVGRAGFPCLTSTSQATMLAHFVLGACQGGSVNDLFAIQALVALMLFMYLSRRLRPAMHLSGTVTSESRPAVPSLALLTSSSQSLLNYLTGPICVTLQYASYVLLILC